MTSETFREIRASLGLTAYALARLLRVSGGSTIGKWEKGERKIPGPIIILMQCLCDGKIDITEARARMKGKQ